VTIMTGNRFVEVDYFASSCATAQFACTLLKPCPFGVLNRRLLCLLRFTYPHPRYPSLLHTGLRQNALLPHLYPTLHYT